MLSITLPLVDLRRKSGVWQAFHESADPNATDPPEPRMSSVYQALERARRGGGASPPSGAKRSGGDLRFGREMQALSSRLQPLFDERPSISLVITGCGRGDGVTTIAAEFARYLAADGRNVLFCGSHGSKAREPEAPDIEQAAPNLRLLDMAAFRSESPYSAFRDRLEQVRGEFQVVIIDCPPILIDGSWSNLLRGVDGVILVVEAEKTRSAVLQSTIKMIGEVGGHVVGIVFNRRRQYIPRFLYRFL
jgi:Mrp family chromosome partitioning ATPase